MYELLVNSFIEKSGPAHRVMNIERELPVSLAVAIRFAREEQGFTQTHFGERISALLRPDAQDTDSAQSWVSKAENWANPTLPRLAAVAGAAELPPSGLLFAAMAEYQLRTCAKVVPDGPEPHVRQLVAKYQHAVRAGARGYSEDEQAAVARWKMPPPTIVEAFCAGVARALRQVRYRAGLTLSEAVTKAAAQEDAVEFSKPYLSQLETGTARPSLARLHLLSKLYDVTLPVLFQNAEVCLVKRGDDGDGGYLAEMIEVSGEFTRRTTDLLAKVNQGELPPERVAGAKNILSLLRTLLNKIDVMDRPGRKAGRKAKEGTS